MQHKDKSVPVRETGNWSGKQDKKPRPGEAEDGSPAGQLDYTQPSPKDKNSTDNSG
jgi:hypothetical protein